MLDFVGERLVVVTNAASKNSADVVPNVINPLQDEGVKFHSIQTVSPSYEDNKDHVAGELRDGDLILSCGGDGTSNITLNALISSGAKDTRTLFLPYGNANDTAHALYGLDIKRFPVLKELLATGTDRPLKGIRVTQARDNIRHAIGYFGIGVTGEASAVFCDPDYRAHKLDSKLPSDIQDALTVMKAAVGHERFAFEEDGVLVSAHELLFSSIQVMSKHLRFRNSGLEGAILSTDFKSRSFLLEMVKRLITEIPFGGAKGVPYAHRAITLKSPSYVQYDGEGYPVKSGVTIGVGVVPNLITTLRRP